MRGCRWLACCLALLAGCAEIPPAPAPSSEVARMAPTDTAIASAIAAHRQKAERYMAAGDLSAAAREWHILALLAPGDAQYGARREATHAAIAQAIGEQLQIANAALRSGDQERAGVAMLKVLSLDPDNAEAMKTLRDIDRQKLSRIQNNRAARAGRSAAAPQARPAPGSTANGDAGESYDIDQPIEIFRAGDVDGGLREMRAFVDANPSNQAARARFAAAVYERAREAESKGAREQALTLYEQASVFRGKALPEWSDRAQKLRKALSDDYYNKGMQAYRTNTAAAIKLWETSLRYDPQNRKAAAKLMEARLADDKLKRIQQDNRTK